MQNINYPLNFQFNIATLSNDFVVKDANEMTVAYVKQKMFKFIEDISVFSDESKSQLNYKIKANKWIDFSASYIFSDGLEHEFGRVGRKGMASLWKAKYEIFDRNQQQDFMIQEENGWVKVWDGLLGEIPIVGMFTGYFCNPKYKVTDSTGKIVARLSKMPSFFGRKFQVDKLEELSQDQQERIILSLMMMILLERRRG